MAEFYTLRGEWMTAGKCQGRGMIAVLHLVQTFREEAAIAGSCVLFSRFDCSFFTS